MTLHPYSFVVVFATFFALPTPGQSFDKSFEGCFTRPYRSQGRSEYFFDNSNDRCTEYCREEGFIIAATHQSWCHCTQALPRVKVGFGPAHVAAGPGTACSEACPSALTSRFGDECQADECCGGFHEKDGKRWPAFSAYAVGGIPVVDQIKKRIRNNLIGEQLLWEIFDECASFEKIRRSTMIGGSPRYVAASSVQACERQCDSDLEIPCVAFSYEPIFLNGQHYDGDCELYKYLTAIRSSPKKTLYVRRCIKGDQGPGSIPTYLLDSRFQDGNVEGYLVTKYGRRSVSVCHQDKEEKGHFHMANIACREIGFLFGRQLEKTNPTIPGSFQPYNVKCSSTSTRLSDCLFESVTSCEHGAIKLLCNGMGSAVTSGRMELELEKVQRMSRHNPPSSIKPRGGSMELDNVHSNLAQMRTFIERVVVSEKGEVNTETGFDVSRETSWEHTEETSREQSFTSELTISASVSASAEYEGFFASASVSTTLSTAISTSYTQSFGMESGTRKTKSEEVTKKFERGYSKSFLNDTTVDYTFMLTVPPFHKATVLYFEEIYPLTLMWRTIFRLNDFITVRLAAIEKKVHVSRLLTQKQRLFFSMNKLTTERKKIVAKVKMTDAQGRVTEVDPDVARCTSDECLRWYSACTPQLCDKLFPCEAPSVDECTEHHPCLSEPEDQIEDYAVDFWDDPEGNSDDVWFEGEDL